MATRSNNVLALRQLSTTSRRLKAGVAAETATSSANKNIYYKNLDAKWSQRAEVKPEGWDEAKPYSSIPGPKPLPLIGNMWRFLPGGEFYKLTALDLLDRLRKRYGDVVFHGGILGKKDMVTLFNPSLTETMFRNEGPFPIRNVVPSFVYYRTNVRKDVFKGVGGVHTVHGEEWFNIRTVVNKILLQPRTALLYVDAMDDVANGLINNIRYLAQKNIDHEMPADFENELFKWTTESIGVIAYNRRLGCLDRKGDSIGQEIISNTAEMLKLMFKLDVLPSLWPFFATPQWRRYVKILDFLTYTNKRFIEECTEQINSRKSELPEHEKSVLERLMKSNKQMAIAMVIDIAVAGIDTTGKTMASAVYHLSKNPDKQEKLRQEIKSYLPNKDSPVTKDVILHAPYLKAVIREANRISPVSIGNLRTTIKDLVIGGYQIPKGTDLFSVNILLSNDDKYFKDAKSFIPERWLRDVDDEYSAKNVHPFVSLPFGFGPRACVGKRLANMELEVGISKIIRNFKLTWPHKDAKFATTTVLYGIADPLKIRVEEVQD